MNVYRKLAEARLRLKNVGLKQSGKNKGVGYTYFDLQDILPQTTKIEKEIGLLSVVSFSETEGTLTIYNVEQPEENIKFSSPIRDAELRGCHPVQNLGAIETYVRRYLYLLAYEIVETEALDLTQGNEKQPQNEPRERPKQIPAETAKTPQDANNEVLEGKGQTNLNLSNARKIQLLIKGTDIGAEEITHWIENNLGRPKRVNDLTEAEFKKLYAALERAIKGID
ncbi:MAG: ERF family protein [Clostridia bacterium]|nr:ERF family protein [Clostridia bacterium]